MTGRELQLVVPAGIEDPSRPSGGNTYDRRLRRELGAAGWVVSTRAVPGAWPHPDQQARRALCELVEGMPRGSLVLVDGLIASAAPEALVPASERLRLSVLVHMPLGQPSAGEECRKRERAVLRAAAAVVTTSEWTRRWLLSTYDLDPGRVHTAPPGVDLADPAPGNGGSSLLCVGAVTREKGYDVLLAALAGLSDLPWRCLGVGSLAVDPDFVAGLLREIRRAGLEDRFLLTGPLGRPALEARYAAADVLVLPSRAETYGMVVTEALARAVPVIASDVGGVPEALGAGPPDRRAGLLVPAGDVDAWADALARWLTAATFRDHLRERALARRDELADWADTARRVAHVLGEVAA